jgi:uncharacterized membrane protein YgcG
MDRATPTPALDFRRNSGATTLRQTINPLNLLEHDMSMNSSSSPTGAGGGAYGSQTTGQDVDSDETYNLIASDKVEGTDVRRPNGDKIGSIYRLMIDKKSGQVAYAVMTFGGFLGLGGSRRPIPWDTLHYNTELDAYEVNLSEDQLQTAPEYADDDSFDWSDPEWNRSMRSHYGSGHRMGSSAGMSSGGMSSGGMSSGGSSSRNPSSGGAGL